VGDFSVGVWIILRHDKKADAYGVTFDNSVNECNFDALTCFSNQCGDYLKGALLKRNERGLTSDSKQN